MKKTVFISSFIMFLLCLVFTGWTEEDVKDKNITVISGTSTADGASTIHKELLEECIVSLPQASTLEAQVSAKSLFLKGINGDVNKNEFVNTYSAYIDINYILYQKVLIIITTNSIQQSEPKTQIVEKRIKQSKRFVADPSQGDIFAGKSMREYYFSTAQGAVANARKRAAIWLKQQSAVICRKK